MFMMMMMMLIVIRFLKELVCTGEDLLSHSPNKKLEDQGLSAIRYALFSKNERKETLFHT